MSILSVKLLFGAMVVGISVAGSFASAVPVSAPFENRYFSGFSPVKSFGIARPGQATPGWDTPPAGWETLNFDDSGWDTARSAYPVPPESPIIPIPNSSADYIWHDPNKISNGFNGVVSAYFRMTFEMPEIVGAGLPFDAILQVVADDDVEAWLNGVKVLTNDDYGTVNDRGPDYIHMEDVTRDILLGSTGSRQKNVLAFHATDGNLNDPSNVLYEHLAFQLRIRTVPEPGTLALLLPALAGMAIAARRRRFVQRR